MPKEVPTYRRKLPLVAMLAFGGMSWIHGGLIGNAGVRFVVSIAIGWPVLAGHACVRRLPNRKHS